MATKQVTIYSTPTCQYCKKAKSYFDEHNIDYTDHNVAENAQKRKEMLEKSGQMGVPVTIIEDESGNSDIVVGFDKNAFSTLLEI